MEKNISNKKLKRQEEWRGREMTRKMVCLRGGGKAREKEVRVKRKIKREA